MGGRRWVGAALGVAAIAIALVVVLSFLANGGAPTSAGATPTAASSPAGASPAPTTAAIVPATAEPTQDTFGIVQAFLDALSVEIVAGTQDVMADRLAPAVIDRYGQAACDAYLSAQDPVSALAYAVTGIHDPAPWDYATDGRSTTIPDATAVDARVTGPDPSGVLATKGLELHVQLIDGIVYWFTDCGTPQR